MTRRLSVRTALAYLAIYVVAMLIGLASTTRDGLAFFWPASGVAALWMLHGRRRSDVLLDGALLFVATAVVDAVAVGLGPALLFSVANLVIGATVRAASAVLEKTSVWGPLPRRMASKRDLAMLGVASVAAAVFSAPFGLAAATARNGSLTSGAVTAWLVRNTCSTFVVAAAILALFTALLRARARHGWVAKLSSEPRPYWEVELLAAGVSSVASTALLFNTVDPLPLSFVLFVVATWLGYRFSPAVGGGYAIVLLIVAALGTEAGRGPFGGVEEMTSRAVIVQSYVVVMTLMVLMISLGVSERSVLYARVVASEADAVARADLLAAVTSAMADGLVVVDQLGRPVLENPAAAALTRGNVGPQHEGYGLLDPHGDPIPTSELPHVRALAGETVSGEVMIIDPGTGRRTHVMAKAAPVNQAVRQGDRLSVLVLRDVTVERNQQRELEAFAGTVAHDLKAPLTGVASWAEILGDQLDALEVDVTEPRESVRRIENSAQKMEQLISDLLTYSQAQSTALKPTELSLSGMVEDVAREMADVAYGEPPIVQHGPLGTLYADRTLVTQLLRNVLGNAAKYVAPGTRPRIMVTSRLVDDGMLEVRVSDNGIGIPRADRGRVFDSFYRASTTGTYPGTGLGLAICGRVVDKHGGHISATDGPDGSGTTMVFTLPAYFEPIPDGDDEHEPVPAGRAASA